MTFSGVENDSRGDKSGVGLPRLFHGGIPHLKPGDLIEPHEPNFLDGCAVCDAERQGMNLAIGGDIIDPLTGHPETVYATSDREYARFYASKYPHGDLYVVEPVGEVVLSVEDPFPTWRAPAWRVRSVFSRCVVLTMQQRRRLWKRWPTKMAIPS